MLLVTTVRRWNLRRSQNTTLEGIKCQSSSGAQHRSGFATDISSGIMPSIPPRLPVLVLAMMLRKQACVQAAPTHRFHCRDEHEVSA